MTQVIAAGNWDYAVVAADRRFTYDGELLNDEDDERNKLILISTPTARLGVAFCGFATLGAFQTEPWLARLLHEAVTRGGGTPDLNWLCDRATADFDALPPDRVQRRIDSRCLWVTLAGFVSEAYGVVPVYAFVDNAHRNERRVRAAGFHAAVYGPMEPMQAATQRAYAMSMGAVRLEQARVDALKQVVLDGGPAAAAVGHALRAIRVAHEDPFTGKLVGERRGALILWSEREHQPEGLYFGRGRSQHFIPTLVTQHGIDAGRVIDRGAIRQARNASCYCGSGKPSRRCHGASSSGVRGIQ